MTEMGIAVAVLIALFAVVWLIVDDSDSWSDEDY